MTLRIETTTDAFVITSTDALVNLRSRFDKQEIVWRFEQGENGCTYTLTYDELNSFFSVTDRVTAELVYDVNGHAKALSVNDFTLTFGDNLAFSNDAGTISVYVSLKSTIRVGWNWFGASEALITKRDVTKYVKTPDGLKLDVTINTRYFQPTEVDLYLQNGHIEKPIAYTISDIQHTKIENGYQNNLTVLISNEDLMQLKGSVALHAMTHVESILKVKLRIAEQRLTEQTVPLQSNREVVQEDVLVPVSTDDQNDFAVAMKLGAKQVLMLMPVLVVHEQIANVSAALRIAEQSEQTDYIVLLDQGNLIERRNIRLLFEALVENDVPNVALITDGKFADRWQPEVVAHIVYAQTIEHIEVASRVKTLVYMGDAQELLPFYGAGNVTISVKQHVVLMDDLYTQQKKRHFKFPAKGKVTFVVANKLTSHLLQQVYRTRTSVEMIGLPEYSLFEGNAVGDTGDVFGLAVHEDTADAIQAAFPNTTFEQVDIEGNLHRYGVVITDEYAIAKRVSILGVPVVYVNARLTPATVDHFYRLSGPVIRDVKTGMPLLKRILSKNFDFSTYLEHAENNLNSFHDRRASQRIIDVLRKK